MGCQLKKSHTFVIYSKTWIYSVSFNEGYYRLPLCHILCHVLKTTGWLGTIWCVAGNAGREEQ